MYTPIRCYLIPWSSSVFLRASTRHKFNYTTNKKFSYVSRVHTVCHFLKVFILLFRPIFHLNLALFSKRFLRFGFKKCKDDFFFRAVIVDLICYLSFKIELQENISIFLFFCLTFDAKLYKCLAICHKL